MGASPNKPRAKHLLDENCGRQHDIAKRRQHTRRFLDIGCPDQAVQVGNSIVAKQSATQEVTCKKLVVDAGNKYLKPLNDDYRVVSFSDGWEIVGVVLEAKVRF